MSAARHRNASNASAARGVGAERRRPWRFGIAGFLLASAPLFATADGGVPMPRNAPAAYASECGACHLAFPPGLLPGASWGRIMGGLERHFGADAALEEPVARQLRLWLVSNAGTYKRATVEPAGDRITASAWFARKHGGIAPAVWQRPAIKSRTNCAACHGAAANGDFDDDRVRIPR